MKALLLMAAAGIGAYFAFKVIPYLYRPFFLSKKYRAIDGLYSKLLTGVDNDINLAIENYNKWKSGDKLLKTFRIEEEIVNRIDTAKEAKAHEVELYEKFLRVREHFIVDPNKLSEGIVAYQRYLDVKLKQRSDASMFANAVTLKVTSFEDMSASARETMLVLEENERKLDVLLGDTKK